MSSTNLTPSKALLKAGVATALMAVAAPAVAQQDTATMDTIVVTGSRIARPELQAASPLSVVGVEEFQFSGATHVEEVLQELPQLIPSLGAASNNPGGGVATIDLRGLGTSRTLVLVNGRRYVSYDASQIVDVNTVPAALIERVDVVTGGGSAVYGSDAIAGVVNFVLKKDFEGAQVSGSYRLNEAGDGDTYSIDGIIGGNFADGKGNATVYMNYTQRKAIMASARKSTRIVRTDNLGEGTWRPGGSPVLAEGQFIAGGSSWVPDGSGGLIPYDDRLYNHAPDNYLQTPHERWFIGGSAHYEINNHFRVFSEIQFINSRASQELAPTPVTGNFEIDVNTPFLNADARAILRQYDTDGDGYATMTVQRRMVESGGRHQLDDRNAFRALVGLEGDIAAGWAYEAHYSYARNRNSRLQEGNISRSRFAQALKTRTDASGNLVCVNPANGCVPLNVFGLGAASEGAVDFITIPSTNLHLIQSQVASFTVNNGNLFDLGAGPVGIALGFEWRSERGDYRPDFYLSSGDIIGFNAGQPTNGGWSVKELFGEVVVPLLADLPFAHNVEFSGALRYADYSSSVGSTWSYSAGLKWAPIEDITFRGQYQRAVRAPTVNELFQGQSISFPGATDPCQTQAALDYASLKATCIAQGFPEDRLGQRIPGAGTQIQSLVGGNPDLTEEKSDTYTIGAVIQPRLLPRFTLTVDYYDISIEDAIGSAGTSGVITACYGNAANGYQTYDPAMCAQAPRNPISKVLEGVVSLGANTGVLETSGIDFEANYSIDVPFGIENDGRLSFRVAGNRLINWKRNFMSSIPSLMLDCTGKFGGTSRCWEVYPKWRWNSRVTYSTGPASVSFAWRHVGSAKDDNPDVDFWREKIGSYDTFDLAGSYEVSENLSFTAGVNNLFDRGPKLFGDGNSQQSSTFPNTYDVFGRQYFFSARAKF